MFNEDKQQQSMMDFDAIRLKLASPEDIKKWSHGEVLKPETINYRTQKPEKDGLFCERIFGPSKDWECYCGKYKRIRYKGIICDKCGVEVTRSLVRRERFGHIALAASVTHIWFLRGIPSKVGTILDISPMDLEKVVYFASFIVTEVNEDLRMQTLKQVDDEFKHKKKEMEKDYKNRLNQIKGDRSESIEVADKKIKGLKINHEQEVADLTSSLEVAKKELRNMRVRQVISEHAYQDLSLKYGHVFEASIGAEAIRYLLEKLDLKQLARELDIEVKEVTPSKKRRVIKRQKLVRSLIRQAIKPEWMILTAVPVIPPDLRPMVALDGGRFATSDLNDLYRRVINRNNRLKKLIELNAPEVIRRNEKRMLQEAVDALMDNSARHGKTVTASTGQKRMLKSLADVLKGKQGRFRQNLLGKRVDYSGRSVIVVGPHLKLHQSGLPKQMALELFRPFVISELIKKEIVHNVRSANKFIESNKSEVYDILESITKDTRVLMNRAPTLHRLGIQAFQPVLIEGKAIQLHPFVCTAFNADFDGDQMAVHVPLTEEARFEARELMESRRNLLGPATGEPIVNPSQDFILGNYYLTMEISDQRSDRQLKHFSNAKQAILAYENRMISLHEKIRVRLGEGDLARTTAGRVIFNTILPEKIGYTNTPMGKKALKNLVAKVLDECGPEETAVFLDKLKELAIKYLTASGVSWGMADLPELAVKKEMIDSGDKQVAEIQNQYEMGFLTKSERKTKVIELWIDIKDRVTQKAKDLMQSLRNDFNPVYMMIDSSARADWAQLAQMMGMRGAMVNTVGELIELPVKSNFKQGLDVLEYFISTHGARKGLSDTALRTASAGYLTRRLVDVCQDIVITGESCSDEKGIIFDKQDAERFGLKFSKLAWGRILSADIKDPQTGKMVLEKGSLIDNKNVDLVKEIEDDLEELRVFSVMTCQLSRGVCKKCYGLDLAYNKPVELGTAVGIMAAQSIGEPGTQLTLRTFHTGGVASAVDITQGLPRVEELFEVRQVKKPAVIAPFDGDVEVTQSEENRKQKIIKITGQQVHQEEIDLTQEQLDNLSIKDGQKVKKGDALLNVGDKKILAPIAGRVEVAESEETGEVMLKIYSTKKISKELPVPIGFSVWVENHDQVQAGDQLTEGPLDLQELYKLKGEEETQKYIIKEIQYVYSTQGQPLNPKHIEIVIKQMFARTHIIDSGDSDFLPGEVIDESELMETNEKLVGEGKGEAKGRKLLLGITKSSLTTSSFLSAASFQETTRVLVDAAVTGKRDYLRGLKENVIIGRPIPAGTGFKKRHMSN